MHIAVSDIRRFENAGCLKALADVQIGDSTFRDFRIVQQDGQRAWVAPPQASWVDRTGKRRYKNLIEFPKDLKSRIDAVILEEFAKAS